MVTTVPTCQQQLIALNEIITDTSLVTRVHGHQPNHISCSKLYSLDVQYHFWEAMTHSKSLMLACFML